MMKMCWDCYEPFELKTSQCRCPECQKAHRKKYMAENFADDMRAPDSNEVVIKLLRLYAWVLHYGQRAG